MTTANEIMKEDLLRHLDNVTNKIDLSSIRYLHVNTISNFIDHFHEIDSEKDRQWVYGSLIEYFEACCTY